LSSIQQSLTNLFLLQSVIDQYCYWPGGIGGCPTWWQQNHAYDGLGPSNPKHQNLTQVKYR
jgi:hypothetical protein